MTPQEKQEAWRDYTIVQAHGKALGAQAKKAFETRIRQGNDPRVASWHALRDLDCLSLAEILDPDEFPTVVLPTEKVDV